MLKIKKGDKVKVRLGRDKGREGEVLAVFPKKAQAVVSGVNVFKKHVSAKMARDGKGGIVEIVKPIAVSKLSIVDPKTGKSSRVGFVVSKDGGKTRLSKKSSSPLSEVK